MSQQAAVVANKNALNANAKTTNAKQQPLSGKLDIAHTPSLPHGLGHCSPYFLFFGARLRCTLGGDMTCAALWVCLS